MLGLCHFCLDFSEFGYVSNIFLKQKNQGKKRHSPNLFFWKFCVVKKLCFKKTMLENKHNQIQNNQGKNYSMVKMDRPISSLF